MKAPNSPPYWVSPNPTAALKRQQSEKQGRRTGPLEVAKAVSVALGPVADPRCMEPDLTVGDGYMEPVPVVAEDPEGVVGHYQWPVLGVAATRDEEA